MWVCCGRLQAPTIHLALAAPRAPTLTMPVQPIGHPSSARLQRPSMMSHHVMTLAAVGIALIAEASPGSALVAETTSPRGGVRAGPDVPAGYTVFEGDCPGNNIVVLRPPQVRSGRALFTAVHGAPLLCVSNLSCYNCYICHHYRQWHGHSLVLHSPSQPCAWPLDPRRAPAHVT